MADPKFTTVAVIAYYCGAGASATSKAEAYVLAYGLGAESFINVTTMYNWSDAYGTLNVDVKSLLSDIQARLIAIDVINYDYSGFPSRVVAEDMINVHYQRAMDGLKVLGEHAKAKFAQGA